MRWWSLTIDGYDAGEFFGSAAALVRLLEMYLEAGWTHVQASPRRAR